MHQLNELELKTLSRFRNEDFVRRLHLKIRAKVCNFSQIARCIPVEGKILDIGCGYGFLPIYLVQESDKREVYGVDLDGGKIEIGKKALLPSEKVTLIKGDALNLNFHDGFFDCITTGDMAYLLSDEQLLSLFKQCFLWLKPNSILVAKSTANNTSPLKSWMPKLQEFLAVKVLRFTKGSIIYHRTQEQFKDILEKAGFSVSFSPIDRGFYHDHFICIGKK